MKVFAGVTLAVVLASGAAQALTLDGTATTTIRDNGQEQGLRIGIDPITPKFSFELNGLGDSVTFDLFDIAVIERTGEFLDADDTTPREVNVTFDFGKIGGTVTGTRQAVTGFVFPGTNKERNAGFITFDPLVLAFANNQELTITLSDEHFSGDLTGLGRGPGDGRNTGPVQATFALTAVPVPAALPLLATALGLMGWLGRRRRAAV